ncbi:JmjC domain-containing protein [Pseudomonas sp. NMS19W]|uniref:JmjC domain-containing protein n=1 Tax=Pseudomonas sp. NMS19W TaxID=3079768 RepID=UPI003F659959
MKIDFKVSKAEFSERYQGKQPLLIKNAFAVSQSFSWKDANRIIERNSVESSDFKILHNGLVPKQEYVETYYDVGMVRHRLIKSAVYERMKSGATLIANKIVNEPHVHAFARQIAQLTGRQTVSSAYAAFGRQESFQTHWDTRDIFAIQLIGRKHWTVFEPSFNEPLFMQQSKDYEKEYPCPEQPFMEFVLEPGDVLYLPRGWWHNPLPFDEETFHLSIGTFPAHAFEYVQWSMQNLPDVAAARQALGSFDEDRDTLLLLADQISEWLTDPVQYQRFMDQFNASHRVETPLAIDLFANAEIKQLPDDVGLQLAANNLVMIDEGYLFANGTRINLDEAALKLIHDIQATPGTAVLDLLSRRPDIDPEKVRGLIFELCRQDVLELIRA